MRIKKFFARFLIDHCGLKKLYGGAIQRNLRSLLDEVDLQHFRETYPCPSVKDRDEMFKVAHNNGRPTDPITYLEFGVHTGESIKKWVRMSKDSRSWFFGFDSFEGLPERWNKEKGKGFFDVGGNVPEFEDRRVTFIKGWFNESVPRFVNDFNPENRLVVHLDADLYQSTLVPLIYLDRFITKGTMLIFDEFYDRDHEFKAFMDYQKIARKNFRAVCHVDNFSKICIEIL